MSWTDDLYSKIQELSAEFAEIAPEEINVRLDDYFSVALDIRAANPTEPEIGRLCFDNSKYLFTFISKGDDRESAAAHLSKIFKGFLETDEINGTDDAGIYWQALSFMPETPPTYDSYDGDRELYYYRMALSAYVSFQL